MIYNISYKFFIISHPISCWNTIGRHWCTLESLQVTLKKILLDRVEGNEEAAAKVLKHYKGKMSSNVKKVEKFLLRKFMFFVFAEGSTDGRGFQSENWRAARTQLQQTDLRFLEQSKYSELESESGIWSKLSL